MQDDNLQQMQEALAEAKHQKMMEALNEAKQKYRPSLKESALNQAKKFGKGVVGETEELDRGLYNLPPHILQMLGIKSPYQPITAQQMGSDKYLTPDVTESLSGQFGQAVPDVLSLLTPYLGEEKGAMMAGKMIKPALEKSQGALKYIGNLLGQYGKNVIGGAAATPLFSPDQSIEEAVKSGFSNPLNYLFAGVGPVGKATSDTVKGLGRMKNRMGGVNSEEEVRKNLEALKNTLGDQKVPPAQIIKSPTANWLQSLFAMTPGSKMDEAFLDVGKGFSNSLNKVLKELIPEGKGIEGKTTIPEDMAAEVKSKYSDPLDTQLSSAIDQLAGKENAVSKRSSLANDLQKDIKTNYTDKTRNDIESHLVQMTGDKNVLSNLNKYRPELQDEFAEQVAEDKKAVTKQYEKAENISSEKGETILPKKVADKMEPLYQEMTTEMERDPQAPIDKALYRELEALHNIKYPKPKPSYYTPEGKPVIPQDNVNEKNARTLSSVNSFRKKYFDKADEAYAQGRRKDSKAWRDLWHGYTEDIESQLSGESLKEWKKANRDYKEKLVPVYNSPELLGHALKTSKPESIVEDILSTGDSEKPEVLRQFTSRLKPESAGKIAALHYTKPFRVTNGKLSINPEKYLSQHGKLGNQTRDILFSENPNVRANIDLLNDSFDKELFHYGTGKNPSNKLISKYVPSGAYGKPDLVEKLMSVVSPENKGKVSALQATKGMQNEIDPTQLIKNIRRLDPESRGHLYASHPEIKKLFEGLFGDFNEDLYNYGKGKTKSDKIIKDFIPQGSEEVPSRSNQLLDILSPSGRSAVVSHEMSGGRRALEEADRHKGYTPASALKTYNALGPKTQASLFRDIPDIAKKLDYLTHATGLYGDLNPMLMPRTGITVAGQRPLNEMLDATAGLLSGSPEKISLAAKAIGHLLAKSGIGNIATKHLLDPKRIEKYLESRRDMIRKRKRMSPAPLSSALIQGRENREDQ